MMSYTKKIDGKAVVKPRNKIVVIKDGRQYINPREEMILEDGWVEYIEPIEEADETPAIIGEARQFLEDTDYKVIKCMEAFLCGEALPYDIAELHRERDGQRRIINELER